MSDPIKRDDALLPCPFCGGEASKIPDANHSTGWEVGCFSGECDIEPHVWAVHLSTAVMQWNTRTLPAIDPAAIREAALREALKAIDHLPEYGSPDVNIGVGNAYAAILALIGGTK